MPARSYIRIALLLLSLAGAGGPGIAAEPAAAKPLTDEQATALAVLDRDFRRFEDLLATAPNDYEKAASLLWLDRLRARQKAVRENFDQTAYDNLRFDLNTDYQRQAIWMAAKIRSPQTDDPTRAWGPHNFLTPEEAAAGWQLLFDGRSLQGWRAFTGRGIPEGKWKVEDGLIHALAPPRTPGDRQGDLITERKFDNFEFAWEWKVAAGANSGIKYFVTEQRPAAPGHEYQIIDDSTAGGVRGTVLTGSFYDVLPPAADKPLKPAGQWNFSRVVVRGKHVEHWLNGRNILTYELDSPQVKAGLAQSKFKSEPGFGNKIAGHIMLTHHGDRAWFRNLKIRVFD